MSDKKVILTSATTDEDTSELEGSTQEWIDKIDQVDDARLCEFIASYARSKCDALRAEENYNKEPDDDKPALGGSIY